MSGHSKWHNIQGRKNAQDAKRGKVFQKLSREIYMAAKSGGPDPDGNPTLRMVIDKARSNNMPKDNIKRAIKKAEGGSEEHYDEITYEGYAPGGVAVFVEALTDKMEYYKDYWGPEDDAVKSGYQKAGDPVMEVYRDDLYGWNSLILCWAEKVREVFINNGDGKIPEDVFITDIKEKYGTLRISFNYGSYFKPPYEKIDDLTHMGKLDHLN